MNHHIRPKNFDRDRKMNDNTYRRYRRYHLVIFNMRIFSQTIYGRGVHTHASPGRVFCSRWPLITTCITYQLVQSQLVPNTTRPKCQLVLSQLILNIN